MILDRDKFDNRGLQYWADIQNITITATTNLRVSISNGQRNIVLNVCRQKQIRAESMFILTSVSLSVKKKSGKSGIKCVLLILNMHLR